MARKLRRRPDLADRLVGIAGDFVPARRRVSDRPFVSTCSRPEGRCDKTPERRPMALLVTPLPSYGRPRPRPQHPAPDLPHDVPVAADRRQGDPAQAPEPDLLPDQRRRPRGGRWWRRGWCCGPRHDWFFSYYRDRALMLQLGMTPTEMLLGAVGAKDDPNSGGRQMPSHWGHERLNIVTRSSPTGTQFLQAVGLPPRRGSTSPADTPGPGRRVRGDEVVYCSAGDGTTSEGEFWESLNTACNLQAAGALPRRGQRLRDLGAGRGPDRGRQHLAPRERVPDLLVREVDGCDPLASLAVLREAAAWCRARQGPALVHAQRDPALLALALRRRDALPLAAPSATQDAQRDPLLLLPAPARRRGHRERGRSSRSSARRSTARSNAATDEALAAPAPEPETRDPARLLRDVDPTSAAFASEPQPQGEPKTMVDLLNACLHDEMARDPRIVVFGEDVADCSREASLGEVKGKGGVFKVTHNLQRQYGSHRVYNTPLAEANIVGRAIGHGRARAQAGGRGPVLRLHLAGVHADPRRAGADALALERQLQVPGGDPRGLRRLPAGRRHLPQPVRRGAVHPHPRAARGDALERARRERPAAHRDPLRRSGALPRAQAPLPPDAQQGPLPGARLHDPVRQGRPRARGHGRHGRHLRRARPSLARRPRASWRARGSKPRSSTCAR